MGFPPQGAVIVTEFSPVIVPTVKDWNRGFEKGDLSEWSAVDAEISTEDPYEGDYCCNLTKTGASITQTLDDPMPVNAVYEFSAWVKRPDGVSHFTLRMHHTDGTTNDVSGSLVTPGWQKVFFERSFMRTDKILSGISIRSYEGQVFVDNVTLALATEVVTGAVEASQATPENLQAEAIARPKGSIIRTGSETLPAVGSWVTVAEYAPLKDWKFEVTKILVSCSVDVLYRLRWNEVVISADQIFVTGGIPFTDWFPWDYEHMRGDREVSEEEYTGKKKFEIQASPPTDTEAGETVYAEIVGEAARSSRGPSTCRRSR